MTEPEDRQPDTETIVIQAADKVERRLLHVSVADRLDETMRNHLEDLYGVTW